MNWLRDYRTTYLLRLGFTVATLRMTSALGAGSGDLHYPLFRMTDQHVHALAL